VFWGPYYFIFLISPFLDFRLHARGMTDLRSLEGGELALLHGIYLYFCMVCSFWTCNYCWLPSNRHLSSCYSNWCSSSIHLSRNFLLSHCCRSRAHIFISTARSVCVPPALVAALLGPASWQHQQCPQRRWQPAVVLVHMNLCRQLPLDPELQLFKTRLIEVIILHMIWFMWCPYLA